MKNENPKIQVNVKEKLKEKTKFVAFMLIEGEHSEQEIAELANVSVDFVKNIRERFL